MARSRVPGVHEDQDDGKAKHQALKPVEGASGTTDPAAKDDAARMKDEQRALVQTGCNE